MPEITLEGLRAQYNELGALFAKFEARARAQTSRVLKLADVEIELQPGEHYAGVVLNEGGTPKHHLVLMAAMPDDTMPWEDAKTWAAVVHGSLPDRQEAALIYANCKPHVEARWHWTSERHETNASYAWGCYFGTGNQGYDDVSSAGAARAVRRLKP